MLVYSEGIYRDVAENEVSKWEKLGYKKVEVKQEEKPKKATAKKEK